MSSPDKQFLERAVATGLLTDEQATKLARMRHNRKERDGVAPPLPELAVDKGFLTQMQADRLLKAQKSFAI